MHVYFTIDYRGGYWTPTSPILNEPICYSYIPLRVGYLCYCMSQRLSRGQVLIIQLRAVSLATWYPCIAPNFHGKKLSWFLEFWSKINIRNKTFVKSWIFHNNTGGYSFLLCVTTWFAKVRHNDAFWKPRFFHHWVPCT